MTWPRVGSWLALVGVHLLIEGRLAPVMAVTSAPMSSLKVMDWLLTAIVAVQDDRFPITMVFRYRLPHSLPLVGW